MQKRSVVNSPGIRELKRKRHKAFKKKVIISLVIFVLFLITLSFCFRIKKFNISTIEVSGNIVVDTKSIENIVKENLNGNYLLILPKTNFLIYPKNNIFKELSSKYKRLKSISINVRNFNTLEISVKEYEGKYLYCGENVLSIDTSTESKCYFVDSDGYVFDQAPFFSGDVYFKFFGQIENTNNVPSGNYFNSNYFNNLSQFKESLEKLNFKPISMYVDNKTGEVDVKLSTKGINLNNPHIMFKLDADYEKITENLETAVANEPLQTKLKNNYSSFSYIDLRFGNKVYYKFQ
ncbi:MAG: hypothetical protein WCI41_02015 [bacterium]